LATHMDEGDTAPSCMTGGNTRRADVSYDHGELLLMNCLFAVTYTWADCVVFAGHDVPHAVVAPVPRRRNDGKPPKQPRRAFPLQPALKRFPHAGFTLNLYIVDGAFPTCLFASPPLLGEHDKGRKRNNAGIKPTSKRPPPKVRAPPPEKKKKKKN